MSPYIAILEDDKNISELIELYLEKSGFEYKTFHNATDFFKTLAIKTPDILILDLMLPDIDGFDVCKTLRKTENTENIGIIMLTARSDETDRITGLEIGADDYVTKPFSPRELIARIKAILRRKSKAQNGITNKKVIGNILKIDFDTHEVMVEGEKVNLTKSEYVILEKLAKEYKRIVSRDTLLHSLGYTGYGTGERTIDVHIRNLRKKLKNAGKFIKTVYGFGYKIDEED